jgi:hypothetical protein
MELSMARFIKKALIKRSFTITLRNAALRITTLGVAI